MVFILLNIVFLSVGTLMMFYAIDRYANRHDYSLVLTACVVFPFIVRGTDDSTGIVFVVFTITALLHILEPVIMRIFKTLEND